MGPNRLWPAAKNPSPAAKSLCVATRRRPILEVRQRKSVHRPILHAQRNKRKRKNGVLTTVNHHPARLSPGFGPVPIVCQLDASPIKSSDLAPNTNDEYASPTMISSGTTPSRRRITL